MFPLFLALKYLKPKRTFTTVVTLISILGVVLGVAIVIIVRAVMTGFGDMWEEKILDFKPHIVVNSWHGTIPDEETVCRKLEAIPGVLAVSPGIEMRVMLQCGRRLAAPLMEGTDAARATRMMPRIRPYSGSFNLDGENAVIGIDLAMELGATVGDKILVYSPASYVNKDEFAFPTELTVAGIYNSGQRDFDLGYVFVSLPTARDLMGMRSGAYSVHAKVARPQAIEAFDQILLKVHETLGTDYRVRTWKEIDRMLFSTLAVEKNMMAILLMFITIVAIFCVTNTLIVVTVQKTHEIGLLKALGFSARQIRLTFVLHGWIQCIIGTGLGIAVAFIVLHNLQSLVEALAKVGITVFPKEVYGLAQLPWRVVPLEVVQVAASVVVFCAMASFIPAWVASRKDAAEALRKE